MGLDIDFAGVAHAWFSGALRTLGSGDARPRERFDVATLRTGAFATVIVSGEACAGQMAALLHVLGLQSGDWADEGLLLIDLQPLLSVFGEDELRDLGREIACGFPHMRRIAMAVSPGRVTGIAERVVRRHAMDFQVFDDLRSAQRWLHASPLTREAGALQETSSQRSRRELPNTNGRPAPWMKIQSE